MVSDQYKMLEFFYLEFYLGIIKLSARLNKISLDTKGFSSTSLPLPRPYAI